MTKIFFAFKLLVFAKISVRYIVLILMNTRLLEYLTEVA